MRCERLAENERIRLSQVEEFESSRMTMKDWCANNGISESVLRYWRRKSRDKGSQTGGWVEIGELQKSAPDAACTAIVPLPCTNVTIRIGTFSIEAGRGCDTETLRTVLSVAASLC